LHLLPTPKTFLFAEKGFLFSLEQLQPSMTMTKILQQYSHGLGVVFKSAKAAGL